MRPKRLRIRGRRSVMRCLTKVRLTKRDTEMLEAIIFGIIVQHVINQAMQSGFEFWLPVIVIEPDRKEQDQD
jgi:hypothetical protein